MAIKIVRKQRKNANGTYDIIHPETQAKAVWMSDGRSVEESIPTKLSELTNDSGFSTSLPDSAKIVTGYYDGTGTYGSSNQNSLTIGFRPKFFAVVKGGRSNYNEMYMSDVLDASSSDTCFMWFDSATEGLYDFPITVTNTTISWYSESDANEQCNNSTYRYFYVAIG